MDGGLEPLEQIDAHQSADALLTALLRQGVALVVRQIDVFRRLAGQNKVAGRIDGEVKHHQDFIDVVVIDRTAQIGQVWTQGDGLQPLRKFANLRCGIILFDMLAAAGDGHAVQHFEEVEIQRFEQCRRGALFRGQLTPCIEGRLCLTEDLVDGVAGVELVVNLRRISFVCQCQLIFEIDKTIVDRSGGEHQHLRAHARANNAIEQAKIAVFPFVLTRNFAAIAEIMRFVNDDQIVIAPV